MTQLPVWSQPSLHVGNEKNPHVILHLFINHLVWQVIEPKSWVLCSFHLSEIWEHYLLKKWSYQEKHHIYIHGKKQGGTRVGKGDRVAIWEDYTALHVQYFVLYFEIISSITGFFVKKWQCNYQSYFGIGVLMTDLVLFPLKPNVSSKFFLGLASPCWYP